MPRIIISNIEAIIPSNMVTPEFSPYEDSKFHDNKIKDWRSIALVALILAQQIAYSGSGFLLGLLICALDALTLILILTSSSSRHSLVIINAVEVGAILFGLILIAQLLDFTPLFTNPTSKIWRLVGELPKAAPYRAGVIVEITKLLGLACLFLSAALLSQDRHERQSLFRYLLVGGILFALFCLSLNALNLAPLNETKASISTGRLSGLYSSPNTAACVFGMNGLLSAGLLLRSAGSTANRDRNSWLSLFINAPLALVGCLLNTGCLILTGSRGGLFAYVAGLAILFGHLLVSRKSTSAPPTALMLLFGSLAIASTGSGLLVNRFFHAERLTQGRSDWLHIYLEEALRAPLGGSGLGSFEQINLFYTRPNAFNETSWAGTVHNTYIQWFMQVGVIGLIPAATLIGWLIFHLGKNVKNIYAAISLAICFELIIDSLFEYSLEEFSISGLAVVLLGASFGDIGLVSRHRAGNSFGKRAVSL